MLVVREDVVHVATPESSGREAQPLMVVPFAVKSTDPPVGAPLFEITLAVNVTELPLVLGFNEVDKVVIVGGDMVIFNRSPGLGP